MGLFSNNKKLCPICGNPTPRLFPTKVEDTAICKDCDAKVNLPDGLLNQMSMDSFKEYMNFYEENKTLRDTFTETYSYHLGFLAGYFVMDMNNRLFRLRNDNNALVMEASNLKSFRILEDNMPLYESGNGVLKCYRSDVPERANAMAGQIAQFMIQQREYEMLERMVEMQERKDGNNNNNGNNTPRPTRPHFDLPVPFRHFYIEISLEHPYWSECRWEIDGPTMDRNYPSIEDYLQDYQVKVDELHAWAVNLMELICPGAVEVYEGADNFATGAQTAPVVAPAAAPTDDTIEQLQKYKALFDAGVITEEEFAAKKRQLMGI